jgi:DNA-binding response OmpR family regulator
VLIVEDDRKVAGALREALEAEQYEVVVEYTGESSFYRLAGEAFDVILLDLSLPGRDGLQILAALRARSAETPVLILTARDAIEDRVKGLNLGADGYLTEPFALDEVMARVRALLRRGQPTEVPTLRLGIADLEIDRVTRRVTRRARDRADGARVRDPRVPAAPPGPHRLRSSPSPPPASPVESWR